ncbi:MAG: hypothetical protein JWO68_406 [Actinomycetia bacterium]|nr:hypothetical protein [Actinomycetes bacterium]
MFSRWSELIGVSTRYSPSGTCLFEGRAARGGYTVALVDGSGEPVSRSASNGVTLQIRVVDSS